MWQITFPQIYTSSVNVNWGISVFGISIYQWLYLMGAVLLVAALLFFWKKRARVFSWFFILNIFAWLLFSFESLYRFASLDIVSPNMMLLVGWVWSIVGIVLVGWLFISFFKESMCVLELFPVSWAIGMIYVGALSYILNWYGITISWSSYLYSTIGVIIIGLMALLREGRHITYPIFVRAKVSGLLLAGIILFSFVWAFSLPNCTYFDSFAVYTPKALEIFHTGELVKFSDPSGPILVRAWFLNFTNGSEPLSLVMFPITFMALLMMFYANIRKRLSYNMSLIFTILVSGSTLLFFHSGVAYADLLLTFYFAGGIMYLYNYLVENE